MILNRLLNWFGERPSWLRVCIAFVILVLLGAAACAFGPQPALTFFLIIPVLVLAAAGETAAGICFSFVVAALWLWTDLAPGPGRISLTVALWTDLARLAFLLVIVVETAKLHETFENQRALAPIDALTGLQNTQLFLETLRIEAERCRRHKRHLTLACIELNDFKALTEERGRKECDAVLKEVGNILRNAVRIEDVAARLGAQQFAVLLVEAAPESASAVLLRIRNKLEEAMQSHQWQVTFSIGAAVFQAPPASTDEILRETAKLMAIAKAAGKNALEERTIEQPAA
ncbi:MAG TPA: GGDEF domain-containing protein [Planctomycetota bacterium]|jgi:diguanylate cyclase (GGDEF)-like protein